MPRTAHVPLLLAALAATACASGAAPAGEHGGEATPSTTRPLAGLAAQRIVVAPVYRVVEGDPLGWAAAIPRQRDWMRELDRQIAAELGQRGLETGWVYSDALVRAYERNPTLSPDPHRLAVEPLRGMTKAGADQRVPDPLASQLRTLVAVHDARFVLVPIQVSFEPAGEKGGRAAMRLALLDARTAEVRWLGDVRSDPSSTFNPGVTTSLAARLADLIAAP